jgi:xanthine dehydrogenase accessory factor
MNSAAEVWLAAAAAVEEGRGAAFATVARKRGSLPMSRDAKMLVTVDGGRWGTVGGGCTEAEVAAQALTTLESRTPAVVRHTLNAEEIGDLALSCGGTVEMFVEPLFPSEHLAVLCRGVGQGIEHRAPTTVVTALDWPDGPAKLAVVGSERLVVGPSERLGEIVGPVSDRGRPPEPHRAQPRHRQSAAFLDEASRVFVEPLHPIPRVTVFGAGHVGAEVAELAAHAGFYVVVVDDRAEFANEKRVPSANEIVVEDFRTVLDRLTFDQDDYVIAATRGHSYDAYIVERTAGSAAGYVGMLGSKRKRVVIWRALESAGVDAGQLERVHSPIGIEIGADTPAEIAVSVVAELVKLRRVGA